MVYAGGFDLRAPERARDPIACIAMGGDEAVESFGDGAKPGTCWYIQSAHAPSGRDASEMKDRFGAAVVRAAFEELDGFLEIGRREHPGSGRHRSGRAHIRRDRRLDFASSRPRSGRKSNRHRRRGRGAEGPAGH